MMKTAMRTVGTVSLCLALAAVAVLPALAESAETERLAGGKKAERIVFASDRTTGNGVNNPDADFEVYVMNPNGKKLVQLTENAVDDFDPTLSPDGEKIAFVSQNVQPSNLEGDSGVYMINSDGSDRRNLSNNGGGVNERDPHFSPDGQQIVFTSFGTQPSNPEGDFEIYLMNTDGTEGQNLSNNVDLSEFASDFAPDGQKLAYSSFGRQPSNPEGDFEVYLMNVDGSDQRNLTNTGGAISDFDAAISPGGQKIAYVSVGVQASNPEGDDEIYAMNALDGSGQRNLTNTAAGVQDDFPDYSPDGHKIAYDSDGNQPSNPEGDDEVYLMNVDGSRQQNLTRTGSNVDDVTPDFASAE
jgi:Tol biopolymer transport system component